MQPNWLRGPWTDWPKAAIAATLFSILGYFNFQDAWYNHEFSSIGAFLTWVQSLSWGSILTTCLPYAVVLTPILVIGIRWYFAGEPLPESVKNRPYIIYAWGLAGLQVLGGVIAWSLWGYSSITGQELRAVLESLPLWALQAMLVPLSLGLLIGLIGTPIALYLDARYKDCRDALDVFNTRYGLLAVAVMGIQFMGIPALLAVWHYNSKRRTHTVVQYGQ